MSPNKRIASKSPKANRNEIIGTASKSAREQVDISKVSKNLTLHQLKEMII